MADRTGDAALLWALLEEVTAGVWRWNLDTDEIEWSQRLHEALDQPQVVRCLDDVVELTHPDDRAALQAALERHLNDGELYSVDVRFRRGDGEYVWTNARGTSKRDADGKVTTMIGFLIDITSARQEATLLREAMNRLESFMDYCPAAVFIKDPDLTYLYANESAVELAGATENGGMVGRRDTEIFPPETAEDLNRVDREVLRTLEPRVWTGDVRRKDGTLRWVQDTKFPVHMEDGTVALGGFGVDLTELRDARVVDEARQRIESLGRLSGGVAHEFNNMLTVILGYTRLAMRQAGGAAEVQETLKEVVDAAERSAKVAGQLLTFARQAPAHEEPIDVGAACREVGNMLRHLLGERVQLHITPPSEEVRVLMDRAHIDLVMTNLALNARDAMPDGGRLEIRVRTTSVDGTRARANGVAEGDFVEVQVRDEGVGMDAQTLGLAFEPFFTTKPAGKGTGLGLSTVYGIVRKAGGWVDVESELGAGTLVRVYLPLTEEPVEPREDRRDLDADTQTLDGASVLVVEDELPLLRLITRVLQRAGCSVHTASSPEAALRLCRSPELRIDLLLSDVIMPDMTGPAMAARIREERPGLRTVFMSGYSADYLADAELSEFEGDVLEKPFDLEDLVLAVERALG